MRHLSVLFSRAWKGCCDNRQLTPRGIATLSFHGSSMFLPNGMTIVS